MAAKRKRPPKREHSLEWLFLDSLEVLIDDAIDQPGEWLDLNDDGTELSAGEAAAIREAARQFIADVIAPRKREAEAK